MSNIYNYVIYFYLVIVLSVENRDSRTEKMQKASLIFTVSRICALTHPYKYDPNLFYDDSKRVHNLQF